MSNVNVNLSSSTAQSSPAVSSVKESSLTTHEDTKNEFKHLFQSNVDKTASNKVDALNDDKLIDGQSENRIEKTDTEEENANTQIESEDELIDGANVATSNSDDDALQDTQAVMSQGNELLTRLNLANNSLQGKAAQITDSESGLSAKLTAGQATSVDPHLATSDQESKAALSAESEAKASLFKKLTQLESQVTKSQQSQDKASHKINASQLAHTLLSQSKDKSIAAPQDGQPIHGVSAQHIIHTPQISNPQAAESSIHQTSMHLNKEIADQQMAEKVQIMMSKNLKNLDIRLDPPELGRMHIRLTMNNDIAHVHITVHNSQAREMVENTLPRLREMLADQGILLDQGSVSQQSEQQRQDHQPTHSHQRHNNIDDEPEAGIVIDTVANEHDGSINYFA